MTLPNALSDDVARAARAIADADGLVVAAGAGMGVDSGLPDFRGDEGMWRAYPALGAGRIGFADIANPDAFRIRPDLAWGFYGHRLALYRRTVPHEGFRILLRWATRPAHGAFVFTSNVDGQFQRAGFEAERVVECHGSIHHLQCSAPCSAEIRPASSLDVHIDETACRWTGDLPTCPRCDLLARPNILMFGDGRWLAGRTAAQGERLEQWLARVRRPVVIELGAGTHIPSVRRFGEHLARHRTARLVRLNPREADVADPADIGLALGALEGLRAIDARLELR